MIEALVVLLIGLLVVGIIYLVAAALLPHPIPLIVALVGVLVVVLWALGHVDADALIRSGRGQ